MPNQIATLLRLVKAKLVLGDFAGALAVAKEARTIAPEDIDAALTLSNLLHSQCEEDGVDELRRYIHFVADKPHLVSKGLQRLTEIQNRRLRPLANLHPDHTASWADTCGWSDHDGLSAYGASLQRELQLPKHRVDTFAQYGHLALTDMNWEKADRYYRPLRGLTLNHISDAIALDTETWRTIATLSDAEILGDLAEVTTIRRGRVDGPFTFFFASDQAYFERFTLSVLTSLSAMGATIPVHVHLMDGKEDQWIWLADLASNAYEAVSVSAENSKMEKNATTDAKNYYHAIRFVRFYQKLAYAHTPIWIADVDAIIRKNPTELFPRLAKYDLALCGKANAFEPWNKIAACLVGVGPTDVGKQFLRLTSGYITQAMRQGRLRWGIDQLALFGAYSYMHRLGHEPHTLFLGEDVLSLHDDGYGSVINFVSGMRKNLLPRAVEL